MPLKIIIHALCLPFEMDESTLKMFICYVHPNETLVGFNVSNKNVEREREKKRYMTKVVKYKIDSQLTLNVRVSYH